MSDKIQLYSFEANFVTDDMVHEKCAPNSVSVGWTRCGCCGEPMVTISIGNADQNERAAALTPDMALELLNALGPVVKEAMVAGLEFYGERQH